MADVVLVPLTDDEREVFIREDIADYAEMLANAEATPEEAAGRARNELASQLRQEHASAAGNGHRRWTALNPAGTSVGWLWVTPPKHGMPPDSAFLYQITVKPASRRQGYAQAMLAALEVALADDGIVELRLNTSDANEPARRLYSRGGYEFVEQLDGKRQLRKRLAGRSSAPG